jgi:hypothetical protein
VEKERKEVLEDLVEGLPKESREDLWDDLP